MTILKSPIFLKNVTCSLLISRVLFWKVSRAIRNCHVKKNTDPKFHHFLPQHGAILLSWRRLPPLGEFLSIHTLAPVNMYNTLNHYPMARTQGKIFFCRGGGGGNLDTLNVQEQRGWPDLHCCFWIILNNNKKLRTSYRDRLVSWNRLGWFL